MGTILSTCGSQTPFLNLACSPVVQHLCSMHRTLGLITNITHTLLFHWIPGPGATLILFLNACVRGPCLGSFHSALTPSCHTVITLGLLLVFPETGLLPERKRDGGGKKGREGEGERKGWERMAHTRNSQPLWNLQCILETSPQGHTASTTCN